MNNGFIIVVEYDKKNKLYKVVILIADISGSLIPQQVYMSDANGIVQAVSQGYRPLNFNVTAKGITEDWGAFSRLVNMPCFIILSEICSQAGRTLGYRVIDAHSLRVSNIKVEQAKEYVKSNPNNIIFQNAIIRDGAICNYPNKEFLKLMVGNDFTKQKKPVKESKISKKTGNKQDVFNAEQEKIIKKAKKLGVTGSWLSNPKITAGQMDRLCRAKARGALAEYFASPDMSEDHIDFWSDRLYDKKLAEDCKPLLARPDIEIEPLTSLFDCAADGIKYDDLMDSTAKQIRKEHYMRAKDFWCKDDIAERIKTNDNLLRYAEQLKKDCNTSKQGTPVVKKG